MLGVDVQSYPEAVSLAVQLDCRRVPWTLRGRRERRAPVHCAAADGLQCWDAQGVDAVATAHVPQSTQLACRPHSLLVVALQARAEREKAAKQGWYRNAHGQMSFSDLAGVNIRVSSGGGGSGEGPAAAPRAPAAAAAAESRATDAAGTR